MYYILAAIVGAIGSYLLQLVTARLVNSYRRKKNQNSKYTTSFPDLKDPGYSFRIRTNRAPAYTIQTDLHEFSLPTTNKKIKMFFRGTAPGELTSLREAKWWIVAGNGFDTEAAAEAEGLRLEQNLLVGLTRARLGADFGWTGPKGYLTAYGEEYLSQQNRRRVIQDVHGLKVFKSNPRPVFTEVSAQGTVGVEPNKAIAILQRTFTEKISLTDREVIAYQLYQLSTLQTMAELRFILLITSIETPVQPVAKSPLAVSLIDQFESTINLSALSLDEKRSFQGSLRHLRMLSIGKAGKTLVDGILPNTLYQGTLASKFFLKAYDLRSQLVHGGGSVQVREKIKNVVADLESLTNAVLVGLRPITGTQI